LECPDRRERACGVLFRIESTFENSGWPSRRLIRRVLSWSGVEGSGSLLNLIVYVLSMLIVIVGAIMSLNALKKKAKRVANGKDK
jgi:hypothetical protein